MKLNHIYQGDALEVLKTFPDNSISTCICDPPYGLKFMGKKWDYDVPSIELWKEVLRVMKPGGTLLAFAGSRTQHRMAVNIEDAGFILKDTLMWLYGSGFPKATDISKQIDKKFGAGRKIITESPNSVGRRNRESWALANPKKKFYIDKPATPEAKQWNGYKSHGLKPAYEPIVMAIKPNEGSYAQNALKWGVSGLNMDGGRIKTNDNLNGGAYSGGERSGGDWKEKSGFRNDKLIGQYQQPQGRFPANILLDEEAAKDKKWSRFFYVAKASKKERNMGLDKTVIINIIKVWKENNIIKEESLVQLLVDTGILQGRGTVAFGTENKNGLEWNTVLFGKGLMEKYQKDITSTILTATNLTTTSKIFNWLQLLLTKEYTLDVNLLTENGGSRVGNVANSNQLQITTNEKLVSRLGVKNVALGTQLRISVREGSNIHSTVKPLKLMEYLVKLTKMPNDNQIYLDPFLGSGTTAMACKKLGRNWIGIEIEPEYIKIAEARIRAVQKPML